MNMVSLRFYHKPAWVSRVWGRNREAETDETNLLKVGICFLGSMGCCTSPLHGEYRLRSSSRSNWALPLSLVFPKESCSKYLLASNVALINTWPSPLQCLKKGKLWTVGFQKCGEKWPWKETQIILKLENLMSFEWTSWCMECLCVLHVVDNGFSSVFFFYYHFRETRKWEAECCWSYSVWNCSETEATDSARKDQWNPKTPSKKH